MSNIIQAVRSILASYPQISEICCPHNSEDDSKIHIDFTEPNPTSYGLSSEGDKLISEDILGNQKRQHNFMLYATYSSISDYERLSNSTALLALTTWLHDQIGGEVETVIGNDTYTGEITRLSAENGQLLAIPQESETSGWQYMLQIVVEYTVRR